MKTKDKIIAVAEGVFADFHYEHATVKMICDEAKVNIASVNYYFRSKKDLYLEVMATIHDRISYKSNRIFELEAKEATKEEWERFISEITTTFASIPDDEDMRKWHKIIFRELNNPSELFDEIYELYFLPILNHIDSNIKIFFPDMSDRERFMWIFTLISQACFMQSARGLIMKYQGPSFYKKESIDEYSAHISETICGLLKLSDKQD